MQFERQPFVLCSKHQAEPYQFFRTLICLTFALLCQHVKYARWTSLKNSPLIRMHLSKHHFLRPLTFLKNLCHAQLILLTGGRYWAGVINFYQF